MQHLDEDSLVRILKEPKNSLVKQYQKLFRFEKVQLEFTEEALYAIARKASQRKAGARGLRTVIESVMLDIMYEMPSQDDLSVVTIDADTINDNTPPKLTYKDSVGVPS